MVRTVGTDGRIMPSPAAKNAAKPRGQQIAKTEALSLVDADKADSVTDKGNIDREVALAPALPAAGNGAYSRFFDASALDTQDAGSTGGASAAASENDDGGGDISVGLIVGGVLLAGAVAGLAAGGGGGPGNRAPVLAGTQTVAATEDTAITVTATATDADKKDLLTYAASAPTKGTVTGGANGVFTYTPTKDFNGTDSFTVTVSDGKGGSAVQTVTVNVAAVNDAPTVAATQTVAGTEDTKSTVTVTGADVDGDTLTYAAGAAGNGTVTGGAGGVFTYAPNANFNGADTFKVTVSDGKGGSAVQTVTVNVAAVNDAPVAVADKASATEDGAVVTGSVATNDSDIDSATLTYALNAPVAGLTVGTNGSFSFDPTNAAYQSLAAGATKDVVANYTVTDDKGATATSTLTVTVTGVNDAPVVTSAATASIDESLPASTVAYTATASDIDTGSVLTYSLAGADAALFNIDKSTGELRLNAPADFETRSVYNVDIVAKDQLGAARTKSVTVSINNTIDVLNIDLDNDANPATPFLIDASKGNFRFEDSATVENNVQIANFGNALGQEDRIVVNASASAYSFTSFDDGGDPTKDAISISYNNAGVLTQIVLNNVAAAGVFVFNEASAETAVGFDFFSGTPALPAAQSLDVDNDANTATPRTFNAGTNAFTFSDDAAIANNAVITNFGADDVIQVSAPAASYSFSSANDGSSPFDDILITFNNAGILTQISVQDVLPAGTFVNSEALAEAAVGRDFFSGGVAPPPPPPPPVATTVNLDTDNDGNINTARVFDASTGSFTFTDDDNVGNNAVITGFGADDILRVDVGAVYSFSTSNDGSSVLDDLVISINVAGALSTITLQDVIPANTFVFNEATAEAAIGRNFFTFA